MLHHLARRRGAKGRSSKLRSDKGLLSGFRKLRLEYLEPRIALASFFVTTTEDVVSPGGPLSLREAITAANDNNNSASTIDTIYLKSGTYRIGPANAAAGDDDNLSGDFDIEERVRIVGLGPSFTRVDAKGLDRVFDIQTLDADDDVIFENLTIKGGLATGGNGGGIRQNSGDVLNLTLKNTVVTGNVATVSGGGIYHFDGLLKLENSKVTLNRSTAGDGGGIYSYDGDVNANWSTISKNSANGSGGGVYTYHGNTALKDTTVSGNVAQTGDGGGVMSKYGGVTLEKSTVSKNIANDDGGGIWAYSDVDLENSTISGNISRNGNGGGIYSYFGYVDADCSTIKGNRALGTDSDGGGIWAKYDVDLDESTVSGNVAKDIGGGIKSYAGSVHLEDSKVLDNVSTNQGGGIFADENVTLKKSTVSGNTSTNNLGGGIYSEFGVVDLKYSNVEDNTAGTHGGGIYAIANTATYQIILYKSTVSGNTASDGVGGGISTPGAVKITESKILDNYASDDGGGVFAEAGGLIRKSTISGNTGDSGGGIFSEGLLDIGSSTFKENTAIAEGGGIYALGDLTLDRSTVSGNFAANGGGIYADGDTATVVITKSTIDDNAAADDFGGILASVFSFSLEQSTVSNNRALNDGGGAWIGAGFTLTNSTISGNTAAQGRGGGLYINNGSAGSLLHVTVTQNIAGTNGGGVFVDPGTPVNVRNTIIAQNFLVTAIAANGPDAFGLTFVDDGGNLIGIADGSNFVPGIPNGNTPNPSGSRVGTSATPLDPRLGSLQNNGGPTETHALLSGSPAINNAEDASIFVDQRGLPRPRLGGFDIGAFEKQS